MNSYARESSIWSTIVFIDSRKSNLVSDLNFLKNSAVLCKFFSVKWKNSRHWKSKLNDSFFKRFFLGLERKLIEHAFVMKWSHLRTPIHCFPRFSEVLLKISKHHIVKRLQKYDVFAGKSQHITFIRKALATASVHLCAPSWLPNSKQWALFYSEWHIFEKMRTIFPCRAKFV